MFDMRQSLAHEANTMREEGEKAPSFTITQMASQFDLTPRTIRFYEEKGLLAPKRVGNRRIYFEKDRARMALILHFRNHGCALNDIAKIVELSKQPDNGVACLEFIDSMFKSQLGLLERMSGEVENQLTLLSEYTQTINAQSGLRRL
ncbi:MAG: MerR family transcriptional regulator [Parvibaculaceae bacterium]|nr:MerR family transcriptional regulator [Parvibaculaceae bacterium]